ncbi:hypothetical protein DY000_02034399 [Brassica cretica]|uniref:Uncharacterized protein n=1 Tax=Brassica cretica TaxID=69181 RepID=A0ABQ7DWZ3_BRACR|nr:hypothetical protein DY000_02034399 [Brassica cretica]
MFLSASPARQTDVPASVTQPSSLSVLGVCWNHGSFPRRKDSVIHGFTPVGHANHYMPSLKADSIVKVDRFEVARCSK